MAVSRRLQRSRLRALLALAGVAVLALSGCGYKIVRYDGAIPGLDRLAIRGFENMSFEPGVDALVSDAMVREFDRRQSVRLVDDLDVADYVLWGIVEDVRINRRSFSSVQFALEYDVVLRLRVFIERPEDMQEDLDATTSAEITGSPRERYEDELGNPILQTPEDLAPTRGIPIDGRALTESERYLASADVEVARTNKQEALRRLAGLLAARVHDSIYEDVEPAPGTLEPPPFEPAGGTTPAAEPPPEPPTP